MRFNKPKLKHNLLVQNNLSSPPLPQNLQFFKQKLKSGGGFMVKKNER